MPYREGAPAVAQAPDRRRRGLIIKIACGLVAGVALAAAGEHVTRPRAPAPPRPPTFVVALEGSEWSGKAGMYAFTLDIDSVRDGAVEGRMKWPGWGTTKVRGTLSGNHLELVDYAVIEGTVGLNDKKEVTIEGDRMDGTDRDGDVPMHARLVTTNR